MKGVTLKAPLHVVPIPRELTAVMLRLHCTVLTRNGLKRAHPGWWQVFDTRGRPYDVYKPADFIAAFRAVDADQDTALRTHLPVPTTTFRDFATRTKRGRRADDRQMERVLRERGMVMLSRILPPGSAIQWGPRPASWVARTISRVIKWFR